MKCMTVAAEDVRVGDQLYNSHATHPAYRWSTIRKINPREIAVRFADGSCGAVPGFEFEASYTTVATRKEGVFIRRFDYGSIAT